MPIGPWKAVVHPGIPKHENFPPEKTSLKEILNAGLFVYNGALFFVVSPIPLKYKL